MKTDNSHFMFVQMCGICLACLMVEMEAGDILPSGPLDADLDFWHSEFPDVAVSGSYHFDGNPTPDIPACPRVELPSLGGKASGQVLQSGLRLCAKESFD